MIAATLGLVGSAIGFAAWAVRGRSSQLLGSTLWRGPGEARALALTFDDGPSESTPALLELLARYQVPATFFLCGANARRLPEVARAILAAGHEIGNHTENHAPLWLKSRSFIAAELAAAQQTLAGILGVTPRLFRPTYGVRWIGLTAAERQLGLTRVMWSGMGSDWRLNADSVAARLRRATRPGAILVLHDGRESAAHPDLGATLGALEMLLPWWRDQGYRLVTVSRLCGQSTDPGVLQAGRGRQ